MEVQRDAQRVEAPSDLGLLADAVVRARGLEEPVGALRADAQRRHRSAVAEARAHGGGRRLLLGGQALVERVLLLAQLRQAPGLAVARADVDGLLADEREPDLVDLVA